MAEKCGIAGCDHPWWSLRINPLSIWYLSFASLHDVFRVNRHCSSCKDLLFLLHGKLALEMCLDVFHGAAGLLHGRDRKIEWPAPVPSSSLGYRYLEEVGFVSPKKIVGWHLVYERIFQYTKSSKKIILWKGSMQKSAALFLALWKILQLCMYGILHRYWVPCTPLSTYLKVLGYRPLPPH